MTLPVQAALVTDAPTPKPKPTGSRGNLAFRIDHNTAGLLEQYALKHNLTKSMAARMLLYIALRSEEKGDPAYAFREAAYKEGLFAGLRALKKGLNDLVENAFDTVSTEATKTEE